MTDGWRVGRMTPCRHVEPSQCLTGRAAKEANDHVLMLLQTALTDRAESANLGTSGQTTEAQNSVLIQTTLPQETSGNQLNVKQKNLKNTVDFMSYMIWPSRSQYWMCRWRTFKGPFINAMGQWTKMVPRSMNKQENTNIYSIIKKFNLFL